MPELLWLIVAVVLVMGLAYLATRCIAGDMPMQRSRKAHKKMLHPVEQLYMGRERQIILVQAGDRYFLIGNTANQITTLAEFSEEEIEAWREKERQNEEADQRKSFAQVVQELLKKRGGGDNCD